MKLYNLPAGAKFKIIDGEVLHSTAIYKFFNVDGMYSYCHNPDGDVVHLAAWTEVEIVE